jgi:hypothetical protein
MVSHPIIVLFASNLDMFADVHVVNGRQAEQSTDLLSYGGEVLTCLVEGEKI